MLQIIIVVLCLTLVNCIIAGEKTYTVNLQADSANHYDLFTGGPIVRPSNPNGYFYEEITHYPGSFSKLKTYQICLQNGQLTFHSILKDTLKRQRYFERFTDWSFEEFQNWYTGDIVDFIVSICVVEDSAGIRKAIFDINNDENLNNDHITDFKTYPVISSDGKDSTLYFYADSNVEFEYYNGSETVIDHYGIRLLTYENSNNFFTSSLIVHIGSVAINGKTFQVGTVKFPDMEFNNYDRIWIDLNNNGQFDRSIDYFDQMYLPITLGEQTFRIEGIDRFTGSYKLVTNDVDSIPPIAIGFDAPDFQELCFDSSSIVRLSDYKGEYVILDFWTCDGLTGIQQTNTLYQKYSKREDINIISFGLYTPELYSAEVKGIDICWPHVNGLTDVETRTLYQIGGNHTTILIDKNGKIQNIKVFGSDQELMAIIDELVK